MYKFLTIALLNYKNEIKNLIEKINSQSSIPIIKHLDGICHIYIDNYADMDKAKKVLFNSKMRRPEICGATETLLIDQRIKDYALTLLQPLIEANCVIRCDKYIHSLHKNFVLASEQDWSTEYLDKISVSYTHLTLPTNREV